MKAKPKSTQLRTVTTAPPETTSYDRGIANVPEDIFNVRAALMGADKIIEEYWQESDSKEDGDKFGSVLRILSVAIERLEEIGAVVMDYDDYRTGARKTA